MAITLTSPVADLQLLYFNDSNGQVNVDFVLTPTNDLALVVGTKRLVQEVVRWLLTPVGADSIDPTFGNPLLSRLGRPSPADPVNYFGDMIHNAETYFLTRQGAAAAAGFLSQDEQVQSFDALNIDATSSPGVVNISFTVTSLSNQTSSAFVPFSITAVN